ncbi:MAG TPA: AsmA family protein [Nitrosospira sp.]|nr:AsmA family protein [Nitrosospira sp.]
MSIRSRTTRKTLLILGAFLAFIVAFWIWFDWNMAKPYIQRQVTEKTGREFVIAGDLDVRLSLDPLISAEGISLANAGWGTEQPMLAVDKIAFRVSLWDLLKGDIVLPEVSASQPRVILEKNMDGEKNWELKKEEEKETRLPKIGRLVLDRGVAVFRDPKTESDITVKVITSSASGDVRETPLDIDAQGRFTGLEFVAEVHGGAAMELADENFPYPVKGKVQVGNTHAAFGGTITDLAALKAIDLDLELHGDDLSALYPVTGIVIFPSPPYRISGRLMHRKTEWALHGFSGKVGTSDLGGDIVFDTGGKRPSLRGNVVSQSLDLNDLKGFVAARRGPQPQDSPAEKQEKKASAAAQSGRLLPDQKFKVDRLRAMDADVHFTGETIKNKDLPVEHLVTHLKVDDGLMTMDPADFAVAGGDIKASVTINAREEIPQGAAKLEVRRLQLPKLFPKLELTKDSKGLIGGAANVKGRGQSVGALLASADGRFGMIMSGGEISETVLAAIDLDGAKLIKLLFTGDKNVPVRCGVIDFDIEKGMMKNKTFVFDTTETILLGEGQISLVNESIKMKLSPEPKDPSVLSLRTPVHIAGTFKDPLIYPDKILAVRIGAAVLLGVFATPLASLIPLIETGPGEDANCRALMASVKSSQPSIKKNALPAKR